MTPVKLWNRDDQGNYISTVETEWDSMLGGEEFRAEAEELDLLIDELLDRAVDLSSFDTDDIRSSDFVSRWAIGRAVEESQILRTEAMASEERSHLWLALARKCRLGVRSTGEIKCRWRALIPDRTLEPKRIGRDIFPMGLWLQEQELADALCTFGGRLSNAREIQRRESIRSVKVRNALCRWFRNLDPDERLRLFQGEKFVSIAKALQRRWPSRGPGSAKRPVHYDNRELDREIHLVLNGIGNEE